jgi:Reverse transcriptase (RNA-dependent DNA polymerase)
MEDAIDYFKQVFSLPVPPPPSEDPGTFLGVGSRDLALHFNPDSVKTAIKKYPSNKSCGGDSIHVKILQALTPSCLPVILAKLFRICATIGITPRRWNTAILYPIPKSPGATTIDKHRPISLTVMFRRLFERILLDAITKTPTYACTFSLHPCQAGFRHGYSTVTHAVTSNDAARLEDRTLAFIDLKTAYDSVPIHRLLQKLADRDTDPALTSLVASLFTQCESRIVVNGCLSPPIHLERGLLQGSILSPTLFNIFIDDLADRISAVAPPSPFPHALLFADDIAIGHRSNYVLQQLLNITSEWAQTNGMTINITKSAIVSQSSPPPLTIHGVRLPVVPVYRYLGFPHGPKGIEWTTHLQNNIEKTEKHLNACITRSNGWTQFAKLTIYRTFLRPQWEYGLPVLYHAIPSPDIRTPPSHVPAVWKPAVNLQNKALTWITGVPARYAPAAALTGLPSPTDRAFIYAIRFKKHLDRMHHQNPAISLLGIPDTLLSRCNRNLIPLLPPSPSASLATRIRQWQTERLAEGGVLCKRILPRCRKPRRSTSWTVGNDRVIEIPSPPLRELAVRWRMNTFGQRRACPVCLENFNQKHVLHAGSQLVPLPPDILAQQLATDISADPTWSQHSYTIIDAALNNGDWEYFRSFAVNFLSFFPGGQASALL